MSQFDDRLEPEDPGRTAPDLSERMVTGSIWMVLMRWSVRAIGFVSTLVLVRVLSPHDFGIVAMATIVTGFFEVFSETGQRLAIIRHPNPTREYVDTAWTAQLIVCLALAVATFLSAPLAELYFREPEATSVIQLLALRPLLMGFENIGTVAFRRDLDFRKEFRYGVYQRAATSGTTIALAFWLRDFWALAIGIVAGQFLSLLIGYAMHPYRPRFSFHRMGEIWGFSNWILAGQASVYFHGRIDQIALGGVENASQRIGEYAVGVDIATMPTAELVIPTSRALFPVFTRLASDAQALKRAYLDSLAVLSIICWSSGVGLALVSADFAAVVLGPQWTNVTPILPWIALAAAIFALSNSVLTVHQATGRARAFALQSWLRVLMLIPFVLLAALTGDLETLAAARFIATLLFVPILFASLRAVFPFSARELIAINVRPMLAAGAMTAAIFAVSHVLGDLHHAVRLLLLVPIGGCTFALALVGLWHVAGRPDTAEKSIITLAFNTVRRLS